MTELTKDGLLEAAPDSIFTYSGGWIRPLNPDPEHIFIIDIAHALSNQCRWTGHVRKFLSVAEHSIHVAEMLPDHLKLSGLLHDATEAYLADLARPIKKAPGLGEAYLAVEARLEAVIAERYGVIPLDQSPEIKAADEAVLWAEAKKLLPDLGAVMPDLPDGTPDPVGWEPRRARDVFLDCFHEYGGVEP